MTLSLDARTILFVGGGIETVPGIVRARELGLRVVVSDQDTSAPAARLADDSLVASTYDVEGTRDTAMTYHRSRHRIDGVLCLGNDVPLTVASTAAWLGLPGIPVESARLAVDKLAMKERFLCDGVPVPWFRSVASANDLRAAIAHRGLPLVIKPADSRGARGVVRVTRDVDVDWAYAVARENSPSARVIVEEFLAGPQLSTESLVIDGEAHTPGFSDRNYEFLERFAPHMIENGGTLPTALDTATRRMVCDVIQRAAASIGIRNGVVKGDIVVTDGKPFVIEIAARMSGGYFCTHQIPLSTGVDFVGEAIRMTLGERVDPAALKTKYERGVAQRFWFPRPGVVKKIVGLDRWRDHPGVALLEMRVQMGDRIGPIDRHPARPGVVITTGPTRAEAVRLAEEVIGSVAIVT